MIPLANDQSLSINTPARIHFGLLPGGGMLRCGGLGLMVETPSTALGFQPEERLMIRGRDQELLTKLMETWFRSFSILDDRIRSVRDIPLGLQLYQTAPRHAGFGTGTQLALAVATAAFRAVSFAMPPITEVALGMNRCKRTAIGSYGFFQGGLLVDPGCAVDSATPPAVSRLTFPRDWPIVLIRPRGHRGLHGQSESDAFDNLNRRKPANRDRLLRLCLESIVPAIRAADYEKLGDPLFEFNHFSGEYFADYQQGAYNEMRGARIVDAVRRFGISAVGQSSWGPCIFAIARHDETATELISYLRATCPEVGNSRQTEITVTRADNRGHTVGDRETSMAVT